jgi:regulator of ribonuclease activity B
MDVEQELEHQKSKDLMTIDALKRNGSNLSKPHKLEHHFYVFSVHAAEALSKAGTALGYISSKIERGEHKGTIYWYFDLIKPTVPSLENITKETTLMLKLSREHKAEYDGWGTHIVE